MNEKNYFSDLWDLQNSDIRICPFMPENTAYCAIFVVYFCDLSHINSGMLFIFGIMTMYHKIRPDACVVWIDPMSTSGKLSHFPSNSLLLEILTALNHVGICFIVHACFINNMSQNSTKVFSRRVANQRAFYHKPQIWKVTKLLCHVTLYK